MKSLFLTAILSLTQTSFAAVKFDKVVFKTFDGIELKAQTFKPSVINANLPGILIIEGSGKSHLIDEPTDTPFSQLASALAAEGYFVLKYNKRGSGENSSNGSFWRATFTSDNADAQAALDFLRSQSNIDLSRIFLIGHSFGGPHSLILASKNDIRGIIMLTSTIGPTYQLIMEQNDIILDLMGANAVDKEKYLSTLKRDMSEIKAGTYSCQFPLCSVIDGAEVYEQASQVPWLHEVLNMNFTLTAQTVKSPILFVYGTSDFVIPESEIQNGKNIQSLRSDVQVSVIPNLDHFMVENESKKASLEYAMQIAKDKKFKTNSQVLTDTITQWIAAQLLPIGSKSALIK